MILRLTNGGEAEVDDDVDPAVLLHPWRLWEQNGRKYVVRSRTERDPSRPHTIKLHREIMLATSGLDVDHADGNGLNNKRSNLRICNRRENVRNSRKRRNCSSCYKGVYWHKKSKKWLAQLKTGSAHVYLGLFVDEIEAARAYDAAARVHFGAFARPNFAEAA